MNASVRALMHSFDDGRDRAAFYRQWRVQLNAGMRQPAESVRAAMHFEPFERALLAMGDESGKTEVVLEHLADFHMRQYKLILKVKQWLAYPMFVSLVAVVLLPLPLVFQGRVSAYWTAALSGLAVWFFFGGLVLARLAQRFQQRPAYVRARFSRTLSMCIASGLTLPRSALLAADASGFPPLAHHVRAVGERRLGEQALSDSLAGAPTLTPDFHGALLVAERTGDYGTTIGRLADLYEDGFR